MIPLFHLQDTESPLIYPLFALNSYVAWLACSRRKVYNPNTLKYTWTPSHINLLSRIIYHEVSRTHSVVGIDDEFVVVQRIYEAGLSNDLHNSHKNLGR